jgi:putative ABC transport system permease protein
VGGAIEQAFPALTAFTAEQLTGSLSQRLDRLASVLVGAGVLFALLAALLAASLFTLSVRQRMREVGLLMAMGARRGLIFRIILLEAAIIAGMGALLGLALGGGGIWLAKEAIIAMIGTLYTWPGEAFFSLLGAGIFVATLATGMIGGSIPAGRISRMEPYEAIRTGE